MLEQEEILSRRSRVLKPLGLSIVLCGPDGSGKSSAAQKLLATLEDRFAPGESRYFHWKPPVFSGRRQAARGPVQNPHETKARSGGASLLFFSAHWLEFFIGAFSRVRKQTARGGLVIIDRYYYDFFIDPARYRLAVPPWLVRAGYRFLPKPDLLILLDAPASVLQARKQEVPFAETERQRNAYRSLIETLPNAHTVDAAQAPAKVNADLVRIVCDCLAARIGSITRPQNDSGGPEAGAKDT